MAEGNLWKSFHKVPLWVKDEIIVRSPANSYFYLKLKFESPENKALNWTSVVTFPGPTASHLYALVYC